MSVADIKDDLKGADMALFDLDPEKHHVLKLAERFILPPFTLLDGRSGAWQDRKRMWLSLGLRSEEGRDARTFAKAGNEDEVSQKILALTNGQSIFDPVLCEMAYRWFSPIDGTILDPFAGGSVRGIVAAVTRRRYIGIDLSADQVMANYDQDADLSDTGLYRLEHAPEWIAGDSAEVLTEALIGNRDDIPVGEVDFVFSCPPYHDLEVYSDDPADLSNMDWDSFARAYTEIIASSVECLRDDRFAAFVIGEIRGKSPGFYRDFMGLTVDAFRDAGADYYNEAILVSPAGTLPLRAAKQFVATRKLGRTHQTLLVFCKGDPKAAAIACSDAATEDAALRAGGRTLDGLDDADEDGEGVTEVRG